MRFSLPVMIRERLLHASSMECPCDKFQKMLAFRGKMKFRGKRDAGQFLVQWISNASRWKFSVVVCCITVSFKRLTHRVFTTGAFSKKPLWGLMFSQEYECFCVFSDNETSPLFLMIFDVFLMFSWLLFDEFFIASDDQRTTFACIVHGVSMWQISKNACFPGKTEVPRQTRCRSIPGPMHFECIPMEIVNDCLVFFCIFQEVDSSCLYDGCFFEKNAVRTHVFQRICVFLRFQW